MLLLYHYDAVKLILSFLILLSSYSFSSAQGDASVMGAGFFIKEFAANRAHPIKEPIKFVLLPGQVNIQVGKRKLTTLQRSLSYSGDIEHCIKGDLHSQEFYFKDSFRVSSGFGLVKDSFDLLVKRADSVIGLFSKSISAVVEKNVDTNQSFGLEFHKGWVRPNEGARPSSSNSSRNNIRLYFNGIYGSSYKSLAQPLWSSCFKDVNVRVAWDKLIPCCTIDSVTLIDQQLLSETNYGRNVSWYRCSVTPTVRSKIDSIYYTPNREHTIIKNRICDFVIVKDVCAVPRDAYTIHDKVESRKGYFFAIDALYGWQYNVRVKGNRTRKVIFKDAGPMSSELFERYVPSSYTGMVTSRFNLVGALSGFNNATSMKYSVRAGKKKVRIKGRLIRPFVPPVLLLFLSNCLKTY